MPYRFPGDVFGHLGRWRILEHSDDLDERGRRDAHPAPVVEHPEALLEHHESAVKGQVLEDVLTMNVVHRFVG